MKQSRVSKIGTGLMLLGLFLILLSGFLLCYNIWDDYQIIEKFPVKASRHTGMLATVG